MANAATNVAKKSWADIVKGKQIAADNAEDALDCLQDESTIEDHSEEVSVPDFAESTSSETQPSEVEAAALEGKEVTASQEDSEEIDEPESAPVVSEAAAIFPSMPPGVFTESPSAPATLRPGARGSRQCFCHGEVLHMLSHYGWLQVYGTIDHPMAAKHLGRIYIHSKDVVGGRTLKWGDKVSFYLYADHVGLGAEECQVKCEDETDLPSVSATSLRAAAAEFVPGSAFGVSADAAEFVPGLSSYSSSGAAELVPGDAAKASAAGSSVSDMFVRMSRTLNSIPANGYVEMAGVFNSAFFEDYSDSDDVDNEDGDADRESLSEEVEHFSEGSGEDVCEVNRVNLVAQAPWRRTCAAKVADSTKTNGAMQRSLSPGMTSDSTNPGNTSDSENETKVLLQYQAPPPFRPPPGLEEFGPLCEA